MRSRSRSVRLARLSVHTPLLIPSVSSRGFPLDKNGVAESSLLLQYGEQALGESLLVSAYDLHHQTLDGSSRLLDGSGGFGTVFDRPLLLVVDSGGYETGSSWEGGHIDREESPSDPRRAGYAEPEFLGVVDRLTHDRPTLVVSYDGPDVAGRSYAEQIRTAQRFFAARPHFASDLLLKPPKTTFHQPRALAAAAPDLVGFDVVGFTEKELGDTLLQRLETLARLRSVLDEAGVTAPVHLFGALDPLFSPMYFAAGAELFDGLSWLRYAYCDGLAIHPEAGALLRGGDDDRPSLRDARRVTANLGELTRLRRQMERFASPGSRGFDEFGTYGRLISEAYATMMARINPGGR